MIRVIWLIAAMASFAVPASGDVLDDIEIRMVAEPAAVRPGEEFTLSIFTDMPWDIGVHIPRYFDSIGPFAIIEGYQAKAVPVAERRRSHATYRLQAPAETGSFEIAGMTAYVQLVRTRRPGDCERGPDQRFLAVPGAGSPFEECKENPSFRVNRIMVGDRFEITSHPLVVVVYEHVPPDANTIAPKPIAPPVPFPPPTRAWMGFAVPSLIGSVVLLALVVFGLRRRRMRAGWETAIEVDRAAPTVAPEDDARRALSRLQAALAAASAPFDTMPVEIAEVLRTYIQKRLGLPAPRRTTEETLAHLPAFTERFGLPPEPLSDAATEALGICDLAKFSGWEAARDDLESALGAAERFVSTSQEYRA